MVGYRSSGGLYGEGIVEGDEVWEGTGQWRRLWKVGGSARQEQRKIVNFWIAQSKNNVQFCGVKKIKTEMKCQLIIAYRTVIGGNSQGLILEISYELIRTVFSILPILVFQVENLVH